MSKNRLDRAIQKKIYAFYNFFEFPRTWFAEASIKKVSLCTTNEKGQQVKIKDVYVKKCAFGKKYREISSGNKLKVYKKRKKYSCFISDKMEKVSKEEALKYIESINSDELYYDIINTKLSGIMNKFNRIGYDFKKSFTNVKEGYFNRKVQRKISRGKFTEKDKKKYNKYLNDKKAKNNFKLKDYINDYEKIEKDGVITFVKKEKNKNTKNTDSDSLKNNLDEQIKTTDPEKSFSKIVPESKESIIKEDIQKPNSNLEEPETSKINSEKTTTESQKEELKNNVISKNATNESNIVNNTNKYDPRLWAAKSNGPKEKMIIPSTGKDIKQLSEQMEKVSMYNKTAISTLDGISISTEYLKNAAEIQEYYNCIMYGRKTSNENVMRAIENDKFGETRRK